MDRTPPLATRIAVLLLGVSFAAGFARIVIDGSMLRLDTALIWIAGCAVLISLLLHGLWTGKNWLRWLSAILIALGMAFLPWTLAEITPAWQKGIYATQGILQAIAAILLFLPSSKGWFRPDNSFKPTAGVDAIP